MLLVQVIYQTRNIEILNRRKGHIENVPADATVIFAENSPKDSFNNAKLENLSETLRNFCY